MDHDNELEQLEKEKDIRALVSMLEAVRSRPPLNAPPHFRRAVLDRLPSRTSFFGNTQFSRLDWLSNTLPLRLASPSTVAVLLLFCTGALAYAIISPSTFNTQFFFFQQAFSLAERMTSPSKQGDSCQNDPSRASAQSDQRSLATQASPSRPRSRESFVGRTRASDLASAGLPGPKQRPVPPRLGNPTLSSTARLLRDPIRDPIKDTPSHMEQTGPVSARQCPPDSRPSGNLCIDRFEASVWMIPPSAPHFHTLQTQLRKLAQNGEATMDDLVDLGAVQRGRKRDNYGEDCPVDPNDSDKTGCTRIFALSVSGVSPSRFISKYQATRACENAGKRLHKWSQENLALPIGFRCAK